MKVVVAAFTLAAALGAQPSASLVTTYCVTCHNARLRTGGLALEQLDVQNPAANAAVWEKVVRKMRGHQMPPPGSPQPKLQVSETFVAALESKLDAPSKGPRAGFVAIQRLNRTEYAATIKDLVGVDLKATEVLPQDIQVEGFDNIAAALSVSPALDRKSTRLNSSHT